MSDEKMSPLRRRMIEDMEAREPDKTADAPPSHRILRQPCLDCGGPMIVIETLGSSA